MTDGIQEVAKEVGPAAQQVADQADSQVQQAAKQARNASLFWETITDMAAMYHPCKFPFSSLAISAATSP